MLKILDEIGAWTSINGEGIFATRPWKIYGEGPSTLPERQEKGLFAGLKEVPKDPYTQEDFRFTASKDGKMLYAVCMATPTDDIRITSLGCKSPLADKPVTSVALLGAAGPLE